MERVIELRRNFQLYLILVIIFSFLGLALSGCGTFSGGSVRRQPLPTSRQKPNKTVSKPTLSSKPTKKQAPQTYPLSGRSYVIEGQRYHILASARSYTEEGVASWYGEKFHGRKTASGVIYNMYAMTGAHKTLPLGTMVRVTNLTTSDAITILINDRGPFVRGRIIDLSYAAARRLGVVGPGTALVKVEALGHVEEKKIEGKLTKVLVQPKSYTEGKFTVQIGSFRERQNAVILVSKLKSRYDKVRIVAVDRNGDTYYRVQVSEKPTIGQALSLRDRLESEGFKGCFVVAR